MLRRPRRSTAEPPTVRANGQAAFSDHTRHGRQDSASTCGGRGRVTPTVLSGVLYFAKKNCSARALPGLRSGQSLPRVVGTFLNLVFATTTPCTIGVRPTVPTSQRL